jgi:SAM-dependent methyltransferase
MVRALEETKRILKPGGMLLDLRPVASYWPLEVFVDGEAQFAGRIDDSADALDDAKANEAINAAVSNKLFRRITADSFEYHYYWDTVEQMEGYFQEKWSMDVRLPPEVLGEAKRLAASEGFESRVSIRRKIIIGIYIAQEDTGRVLQTS